MNSLAALSKCTELQRLDLSLVSQSIQLSDLLRSSQKLEQLKVMKLPKAWTPPYTGYETRYCKNWPPNAKEVHLNGAFYEINLTILCNLPDSATHLWIEQRYELHPASLLSSFLQVKGSKLEFLRLVQRPTRNHTRALLREVHKYCSSLQYLSVNIELFVFHDSNSTEGLLPTPKYSRLDLDYFGVPGFGPSLSWMLTQVVDLLYGDKLPNLRKLGIARSLGWTDSPYHTSQLSDLDDLLKALAREDGDAAQYSEEEAGVVNFG